MRSSINYKIRDDLVPSELEALQAIDKENKEMYVFGDLNCDMLKSDKDSITPQQRKLSDYTNYSYHN
jgi:hypothetical protein